jgi:Subtilisin inhibitor-like
MAMTPLTHDAHSQSPGAHIPPTPRQRSWQRSVLIRCAAAAGCAVLAAACGSTAAPSGSSGSGSAGTAAASKVSLTVDFTASPTTPAAHYTLRCEPAGGTVGDPAEACARLLAGSSLFAAHPAHVMCPMIMANAGRAIVKGTYLGKKVHETIIDGGCDIGRWAKLKQVFN